MPLEWFFWGGFIFGMVVMPIVFTVLDRMSDKPEPEPAQQLPLEQRLAQLREWNEQLLEWDRTLVNRQCHKSTPTVDSHTPGV